MATSRLSTRRVDWRVQVGTSNKPGQGLVVFEASVSYIPDPLAAGGPRTAIPEPVAAVLDASGYACTPDPTNPANAGERGVALFTTDSLGEDGGDWTWTARPQLRSVNGIQMSDAVPAFSFAVPAGTGSLDLAKVQKVPSSPGLGTEAAVALVARAEKSVADMRDGAFAAAEEAVGQVLSSTDILTGSDPRLPQLAPADDHLVAIRDVNGKETWIGARASDGGPTDWAMRHIGDRLGVSPVDSPEYLFAVTDSTRGMTDLVVRASDGQFPEFVVDRLRSRILAGPAPSPTPEAPGTPPVASRSRQYADIPYTPGSDLYPVNPDMTRAAGWGSSSMMGLDSRMDTLFATKGAEYYGGGKGAEWCEHTAARMGARPALITVTDGSIPATGTVNISASNMMTATVIRPYTGTLAGVRGTLSFSAGPPVTFTFTREKPGSAVAVSPDTPFIPDAQSYRDAVVLLWIGKNNLGNHNNADQKVIEVTNQCFDWLAPLAKRCLVLGHFVDTDTPAVSTERDQLNAVNSACRARYGRGFVDVASYLTGNQVWADTGITPTAADREKQAAGNKPPSLSADNGHLNAAGYDAITSLISARLNELGWYN